jgi:hypothetical protein
MCGRFYLFSPGATVADLFDLAGPLASTFLDNFARAGRA